MEHFYTIQGEGVHTGKAAYFIRLAGCDVGCVWCDVKDSWTQNYPMLTAQNLVQEAMQHPARLAVITGGEPLMHDLGNLTKALQNHGFKTHIETAGVHPLTGTWDWVCLSPKKFVKPLPEVFDRCHELKVIVYNKSDFAWAEQQAQKVGEACQLLLQPEWSRAQSYLPQIVEYVKQNPKWKISLQTHKYLNIP
ncbi:radical SAM protein [bacterium]|nr:radical SAM protein [bacterium]